MTAPIRTAHDPEQDVLRGATLEETIALAGLLAGKALELTIFLNRSRAGLSFVVRANLEHERNGLELEAADLESRIAEYEGRTLRQRQTAAPVSERARLVRSRAPQEKCSGCGYCVPEKNVHCPTCCALGFPF